MRWIIRAGDGGTVGDVLARAGAPPSAVGEGRVFVGPRRVRRDDEAVHAGEVVSVGTPQRGATPRIPLLLQQGDLVAADKPAGIPTIADHAGASHTLVAGVAMALGIDASRLHPTSRLDREVSGVVLFALSPGAAERLLRARAAGTYERRYVAIAARAPVPESGVWDAPIGRAADPRLRQAAGRKAVASRSRYAIVARSSVGAAMLAVAPVTGRTHQIRVHASHANAPLVGDRAYGGPARLTLPSGRVLEPGRIALHCARVVVPAEDGNSDGAVPERAIVIASPQPPALAELWSALGGDSGAWEGALSCVLP